MHRNILHSIFCYLLVGLSFLTTNLYAQTVPYDLVKFQDYLKECKLQYPESNTAATQQQIIDGYTSSSFYVVDNDKIAFNQSGAVKRSELRFVDNWYVGGETQTLHSNIKIEEQTCEQLTILQIHDDANEGVGDGPNKPLLRVYTHQTKSPANHVWAVVKTDATGANSQHFDLGEVPEGYFDCDIIMDGDFMIITFNGEEKVNYDVSYWTFPSYWKNGVYLQDDGEATAYFNELTLTYGESNVEVDGIDLTPSNNSMLVDESTTLTATISPSSATNKNITWSSSNTSVATVNSLGEVTAVAEGTSTITVTSEEGSFTASSTVSVIESSDELENIALFKPVTALNIPEDANPVESLVDNSTDTRVSAMGYPQELIIDLGTTYDISYSELVFHDNRAYQYTISIANDIDGPFTEIVDQTSNTIAGSVDNPLRDVFTTTGNFIKLTITGANEYTGEWVSISEFRVFGKETLVTGIDDDYNSHISLFPIPTSDVLNYELTNLGAQYIEIYDLRGSLILNHQPISKVGNIDVSVLDDSIYIIKVVGQETITTRFTKK